MKNKPEPQKFAIRDTLFGDIPLEHFVSLASKTPQAEPWEAFQRVERLIHAGDTKGATENLRRILEMPQLESRNYLQAWCFLRELGIKPAPDMEKGLLGVVVEVAMPKGLDLVAAYPDHHARYYNFSGAGVVWDRPNNALDAAIDDLLSAGSSVLKEIGLWDGSRPPAPTARNARINLLTPVGLHFGQGPLDALSKDPLGGTVIAAALRLMHALIKQSGK